MIYYDLLWFTIVYYGLLWLIIVDDILDLVHYLLGLPSRYFFLLQWDTFHLEGLRIGTGWFIDGWPHENQPTGYTYWW